MLGNFRIAVVDFRRQLYVSRRALPTTEIVEFSTINVTCFWKRSGRDISSESTRAISSFSQATRPSRSANPSPRFVGNGSNLIGNRPQYCFKQNSVSEVKGPSITMTISFASKVCDNKLSKQAAKSLAFVPRYTDTKTEIFIGQIIGDIVNIFRGRLSSLVVIVLIKPLVVLRVD